jgi:glycerol-3-phosphate dehydrogenase
MLNYALHATTQNRDNDPADGGPVEFDAFDDGRSPAGGTDRSGVATDGGTDGD